MNRIVGRACAAWLALMFAGCSPSKTSTSPEPPETVSSSVSIPQITPAEQSSNPDRLWAELTTRSATPPYPAEWGDEPPSPEAINTWKRGAGLRALGAAELARQFYSKHPEDERADQARAREYQLLNVAFGLGQTNLTERLTALEIAWLADPGLPEARRVELRIQQLHRKVQVRREESVARALSEMEDGVRELRAQFPTRPEVKELMITVARGWLEQGEAVRSLALVREVLNANPEGDLKESAEALENRLERLGQPLELRFTAWDGREVDLAKLRGKVVLIDFWATWCAPCMEGLNHLRQLYNELQPKGFEIIGISFDQDRQRFEEIVRQELLAWPHYYEVTQTGNQLGQQFGISGIPTLWLVDKAGRLRELNARTELRSKIDRLLAE